jgi:hypothetical protein
MNESLEKIYSHSVKIRMGMAGGSYDPSILPVLIS